MMSRGFFSLLILVAALAAGPLASAQEAATISASGPGAGVMGGGVVVRAKVVSVDRESRVVVLEAENGERIEIVAGPEVRNLGQVNKGDTVEVEYFEALALALQETKTGIQERIDTTAGARAPEGDKPGAVAMHKVEAIATVLDVDREKRLVVLKGPTQVVTVKVGDSVDLDNIDEGDEVKAVYIKEMAISVRAPE